MSTAEQTSRLFYLKEKEKDYIRLILESDKTQKQAINDFDDNIDQRREANDPDINFPKSGNSTYIKNKLREWGCTDSQIHHVTDYLPSESKDHSNDPLTRPIDGTLENLNPVPLEQLKTFDNEQLRTFIQYRKADIDHALFEARNRGLAIVDHDEREPKISNYKPDPLDTPFSISLIDLASRVYFFGDFVAKLAKKVREYPIHDMNINKQRALETDRLAMVFHGLEQRYLPSLTDDKYAFSEQMWFDVLVKHEQYSKHGAAVKSKVQAVDKDGNFIDEWRPLTREVVTDNLEEVVEDLKRVQTSNVLMAAIQGWVDWHDVDGKVINYTASRRIRVNPKLSETAFGAN